MSVTTKPTAARVHAMRLADARAVLQHAHAHAHASLAANTHQSNDILFILQSFVTRHPEISDLPDPCVSGVPAIAGGHLRRPPRKTRSVRGRCPGTIAGQARPSRRKTHASRACRSACTCETDCPFQRFDSSAAGRAGFFSGRMMRKRVPTPTLLSNSIFPPCFLTMS